MGRSPFVLHVYTHSKRSNSDIVGVLHERVSQNLPVAQTTTYLLNIEAFMQARAMFQQACGQQQRATVQGSKAKLKSKANHKARVESGSTKLSKPSTRNFSESGPNHNFDRNSSESGSSNCSESNF